MNPLKMSQNRQQAIVVAVCLFALIAGGARAEEEIFEPDELDIGVGAGKGIHHGPGHLGKGSLGGGGLGGMVNALRGNLQGIGGLKKKDVAAPLSSARLEGASATGSGAVIGAPPSATAAAVVAKSELGIGHHFHKFIELLFKPLELCKAIAEHFALPLKEFVELTFKGLVFGAEILFSPLLISLKIIEKVFIPDACRLKFMCHIGSHLNLFREQVLLFSPKFIEHSAHVKAISDGIVGRDCESTFIACEPKLKEPFEKLKVGARGLADVQAVSGTDETPIKVSGSGETDSSSEGTPTLG